MTEKSVKTCTKSGQWSVKDGLEWTDYTPCLNKQVSGAVVYRLTVLHAI